MKLDIGALLDSLGGIAKMALFVVLFLIVRGTPALLLYRAVLSRRERLALALMSSPSCRWCWRSRRSRPPRAHAGLNGGGADRRSVLSTLIFRPRSAPARETRCSAAAPG